MTNGVPSDDKVKLQFVAALDAWVKLERALWQIFYVILKPISSVRAQSLFQAVGNFHAQRDAVSAIASDAITDQTLLDELEALQGRARSLATKRNNLVHGTWKKAHATQSSPVALIRFYRPANLALLLKPGETLLSKKGRYVFFIDDLKRCEAEFIALATDYDRIRMRIAAHLKVSPHIEIPAEAIVGPIVRTTLHSSRPPEKA